jgi:hypothetical protein
MKIGQYKEDTLAENQCISGNIGAFDDVFLPILLLKLVQKKHPRKSVNTARVKKNLSIDALFDDQSLRICT